MAAEAGDSETRGGKRLVESEEKKGSAGKR
jgi:hypothetical protein